MATIELNGKDFATQTSSAEPVIASTVTGAPALALTNATFPAGQIIQTKSSIQGTVSTVYSASEVDVGIDLAITPSSTSSDILIWVDGDFHIYKNGDDGRGSAHLLRDSTVILDQQTLGFYFNGAGTDSNIYTRIPFHILDSPNTTSSVTYKLQVGKGGASHISLNSGTGSSITLMEIKR
jgi:hypothetical protein